MAVEKLLDVFPRREIEVEMTWRERLAIGTIYLGTIVILVVIGWVIFTIAPGIVHDEKIWTEGVVTKSQNVGSRCVNHYSGPVAGCSVEVSYLLPTGEAYKGTTTAELFGSVNRYAPFIVKVDPQDPRSFAISWFADRIMERWTILGAFVLVLAFLNISIIGRELSVVRELRLYRSLARDPSPVLVTVTGIKHVIHPSYTMSVPSYGKEYAFEDMSDGRSITGKQEMKLLKIKGATLLKTGRSIYEEPVVLERDRTKALALADGFGKALLVKTSFKPLKLTEDEKRRILAACAFEPAALS
jgi:hypothetical protein